MDALANDRQARIRLDKWLWAARFFKTRALSSEAIDKGRVKVNDLLTKASRELRQGDTVWVRTGDVERTVVVTGLSGVRGSATLAARLYAETPESHARRKEQAEMRRLAPEPAHSIAQGRPTKRDRRDLQSVQAPQWNERWSASLDEH